MKIGFTGGEPFLRDDMFDILAMARGMGFEVNVATNGFCLSDDDIRLYHQ